MKKIVLFSLPVFLLTGCAQPSKVPLKEGGEKEKLNIKMQKSKILMIIAPTDFRDEEFLRPKEIFEKNGAQVTVASKGVSETSGVLGAKTKVDIDLSQVNVDDYDAVVFIGGPGSSVYFDDQTVLSLAMAASKQNKIIGAICIAPSILANAGILSGKKATAWISEQGNLESKGAIYTGANVEVDGKIVTADGPGAAVSYAEKILELLRGK